MASKKPNYSKLSKLFPSWWDNFGRREERKEELDAVYMVYDHAWEKGTLSDEEYLARKFKLDEEFEAIYIREDFFGYESFLSYPPARVERKKETKQQCLKI